MNGKKVYTYSAYASLEASLFSTFFLNQCIYAMRKKINREGNENSCCYNAHKLGDLEVSLTIQE